MLTEVWVDIIYIPIVKIGDCYHDMVLVSHYGLLWYRNMVLVLPYGLLWYCNMVCYDIALWYVMKSCCGIVLWYGIALWFMGYGIALWYGRWSRYGMWYVVWYMVSDCVMGSRYRITPFWYHVMGLHRFGIALWDRTVLVPRYGIACDVMGLLAPFWYHVVASSGFGFWSPKKYFPMIEISKKTFFEKIQNIVQKISGM